MTETHLPRAESALSLRLPPCMGGMCAHRDNCARYHEARPDVPPAERLCQPGGMNAWRPLPARAPCPVAA